jgi:hypothetical protein
VAGVGLGSWLEGSGSIWAWVWKRPEMVLVNEAVVECLISLEPTWPQSQPESGGHGSGFARGNRRGSCKGAPNQHGSNMAAQVGSWQILARLIGWRDRGPIGLGSGREAENVLDNEAGVECQISLEATWPQSQTGSGGQGVRIRAGQPTMKL